MRLNCKQGDLAVIVRTSPGFESCIGHVTTCVKPAFDVYEWSPGWVIGPPAMVNGKALDCCADWCLRPLRDNDGTDETLTWRDVPKGVTA